MRARPARERRVGTAGQVQLRQSTTGQKGDAFIALGSRDRT
jgi:hypothetical protein